MRKLRMNELGRMNSEAFHQASKLPLIIILDRVRSLHNVGSFFRTADAFRAESISLCGLTAEPPHPEIDKTALGATDSVSWKSFQKTEEAILEAKDKGYAVFAVEQTTDRLWLNEFDATPFNGIAIVFGHEVTGVDDQLLSLVDGCIEIPQLGTKHSLNVSVSAGIVMWEIFSQWKDKLD